MDTNDCSSDQALLNYMQILYCSMGTDSYTQPVLVSIIWLLFLFVGLGITADDFLCPSLLTISKSLHLSQNIAGVTFLALGNGAPDIFSSLAGIAQSRPELVIGELFGGGIFVTTIVAGSIFMSQNFQCMQRPILRDIIFYLFATYLTWALFWHGTVYLIHSIAFICVYFTYILVVILGRVINQRYLNKRCDEQKEIEQITNKIIGLNGEKKELPSSCPPGTYVITTAAEDDKLPSSNVRNYKSIHTMNEDVENNSNKTILKRRLSQKSPATSLTLSQEYLPKKYAYLVHHHLDNTVYHISHPLGEELVPCNDEECDCRQVKLQQDMAEEQNGIKGSPQHVIQQKLSIASTETKQNSNLSHVPIVTICSSQTKTENIGSEQQMQSATSNNRLEEVSLSSSAASLRKFGSEWNHFKNQVSPVDIEEWCNSGWMVRLGQLFKMPLYFLLTITIPVVDTENLNGNWCRPLNCLQLLTGPLFGLLLTGNLMNIAQNYFMYLTIGGVGLSILACIIYVKTSPFEAPRYHFLFSYLGFVLAVIWIYSLANEVVSLLHCIGVMFNLSDVILGLTVLAWGNSLGDLISNLSMAKQGFARMGISACFGGPLLTHLLLGIGIPYTIMLYNTGGFLLLEYSRMVSLLYGTVTLSLLASLFLLALFGFRSRKWHGIILIAIYLIYVTLAILIEIEVI